MKAMVLRDFGAPLCMEVIERPKPEAGEVVVRIRACGVCRTDLKILAGTMPVQCSLPHVMGHEPAGEIAELGPGVMAVHVGDRVAVYGYGSCRSCFYCNNGLETSCENLRGQIGFTAHGAYAEYLKVPVENVARLEPHVSFAEGAIVADAIATVVQGMCRRAKVKAGETVLIVGTGGLGLHAVQVGRLSGAKVIAIDVDDEKLALAASLGADVTLNARMDRLAERVRQAADGRGVDVAVDLVGAPTTMDLCMASARSGGRLLVLGYDLTRKLEVSSAELVGRQLSLIGSRAATLQAFRDAVELVNRGRIKPVVTDHFPLRQANEVLEKLRSVGFLGRAVLHID